MFDKKLSREMLKLKPREDVEIMFRDVRLSLKQFKFWGNKAQFISFFPADRKSRIKKRSPFRTAWRPSLCHPPTPRTPAQKLSKGGIETHRIPPKINSSPVTAKQPSPRVHSRSNPVTLSAHRQPPPNTPHLYGPTALRQI